MENDRRGKENGGEERYKQHYQHDVMSTAAC